MQISPEKFTYTNNRVIKKYKKVYWSVLLKKNLWKAMLSLVGLGISFPMVTLVTFDNDVLFRAFFFFRILLSVIFLTMFCLYAGLPVYDYLKSGDNDFFMLRKMESASGRVFAWSQTFFKDRMEIYDHDTEDTITILFSRIRNMKKTRNGLVLYYGENIKFALSPISIIPKTVFSREQYKELCEALSIYGQ